MPRPWRPGPTSRPRSSTPEARPGRRRASSSRTRASSPRACRWAPGSALGPADTILAALPIFHGFGLAALVNAGLLNGCRLLLVPVFTPETTADLIRKKRPTLMAGVPTLYEALIRNPALQDADLSSLRAAFSGADSLPEPVRLRFEKLVADGAGTCACSRATG